MSGKLKNANNLKRQRGNVYFIALASLIPIFYLTNEVMNSLETSNMHENVQKALDSSVLFAAKLQQLKNKPASEADIGAKNIFKQMTEKYKEVFTCNTPVFNFSDPRETVATVSCRPKNFADQSQVKYTQFRSSAGYMYHNISIVLVLDNSGSMASNSRMVNLQDAAKDFVTKLLNAGMSKGVRVSFGLIPFSDYVNLGNTDLARSIIDDHSAINSGVTCVGHRQGADKFELTRPNNYRYEFGRFDCDIAPLLPFTTNRSEIIDSIESMRPSNTTAGNIGLQWARYMLNPDDITSELQKPIGTDTKYIIFMTDGYLADNDNSGTYLSYALEHCKRIKDNDEATIITIGYMVPPQGESFIKECPLSEKDYYISATSDSIHQIFQDIASRMVDLKLMS